MAKTFKDLAARMSPESRARGEERAQAMLAEMPLHELRQARHFSQATRSVGARQACPSWSAGRICMSVRYADT